ncbi:MAG: hypothetical protein RJQ21_12040 [Rhodospirillales bacterium]
MLGYSTTLLSSGTASAMFEMTRAQAETPGRAAEAEPPASTNARENFLSWMAMGPEERYVTMILARKGYTREEFQALPADEQEKIMREVREEIRRKAEEEVSDGQETGVRAITAASAAPPPPDLATASRREMTDWVGDRMQRGDMALDQGFPLMEMASKTSAETEAIRRDEARKGLDISI